MDRLVFFHGSRPFLSFGFWRFQTYRKGRAFNMRHPEAAAAAAGTFDACSNPVPRRRTPKDPPRACRKGWGLWRTSVITMARASTYHHPTRQARGGSFGVLRRGNQIAANINNSYRGSGSLRMTGIPRPASSGKMLMWSSSYEPNV